MINLTMIARNRHELTTQALLSAVQNTLTDAYTMTFLDDGSEPRFAFPAVPFMRGIGHANEVPSGGAGPARNQVIRLSESHFGRGELLYLSDNDVLFQPRWLETLLEAWVFAKAVGFKALSGYAHPYNRTAIASWPIYCANRSLRLVQTHAIATQSWLMEWETWDKYGPFAEAPGVRQSEDVRMCQRIQDDGFKVGFIEPFVVLNTALTDTYGVEVPGADLLERHEGIVML